MLTEKETEIAESILVEMLGVTREQLTPDADLVQDLGADSLTLIEISLALEERFSLSIPDEQLERIQTVGDVLELLTNMLRPAHRP